MKLAVTLLIALLLGQVKEELPSTDKPSQQRAAFAFANTDYFLRYTHEDQREYTPQGQDDLDQWADMVTVQHYRDATTGDGLAKVANAVLGNYTAAKGKILRTSSVPRTKNNPAEHFVSVMFTRPDFAEAAFARFKMQDGIGAAVIYSHRTYGKEAGRQMADWVTKNASSIEKSLMKWDAMPHPK